MGDPLKNLTKAQLVNEIRRMHETDCLARRPESGLQTRQEELRCQAAELGETRTQLADSHSKYAELYDYAPIVYVTLDRDGHVWEINLTGTASLGVQRADVVGRPFMAYVLPADRDRFLEHMRRCRASGESTTTELRLATAEGETIPVQLTTRPREATGTSTDRVYLTAVTDLTARKHVEHELRASQERLKLAQSAGGVGTWEADVDAHTLRWCDEKSRLLGLDPGSITPSVELWEASIHPDDREKVVALCNNNTGDRLSIEYRIVRPDGQVRWLSSRGKMLPEPDGDRHRMVGITIDVTESKQAEQRLQELNDALIQRTAEAEQRTAQLQVLAAQLTQLENRERRRLAMLLHDHLQQLLIASRMKIGLLKQQLTAAPAADVLDQASSLIDEAIKASRSLSVELSPPLLYEAGLAAGLDWLAEQMASKHGLQVTIEATDEPEDDDIRIFLFQCVRELLFNTVKHGETSQARVVMRRRDTDSLEITVSDGGVGFDASRLGQIWTGGESFGLNSIRERLTLLGGGFNVSSAPGQGTTAVIVAPVRKPQVSAETMEDLVLVPKQAISQGNKQAQAPTPIRILLTDAHPIVRQGLGNLLESEPDFKVLATAGDGDTAFHSATTMPIDVVVMDYSVHPVNGAEVTRRILQARPELCVIGMSVYDEQSVADAMLDAGAIAFFRKDDATENLVAAIRACCPRR